MSGLVLNLRPYEKVVIGGIVLQNGKRRSSLRVVDERAGVLRLSEALHPDQATTPLTRAYYVAQTIVSGDSEEPIAAPVLARLLDDALSGFKGFPFHAEIVAAREALERASYYRVMKHFRPLLIKEAAILADPRVKLPKGETRKLRLATLTATFAVTRR
ncbi:flagellar biosynthesis repressor FlbT [Parvularcula dongshanensis]|uniref:Flagellar protein FlbT n=1 Tax=Parvularcula dongshanensis TaxID=1173995 RepID=A0A840I610_9PROT|nr:flagellar biosynthesis repressor FlbT [Parvularcula dongshanensis]MBB4660319.1 flagellar protein FlbT [Parvularcula dongshanensis]